MCIKALRKHIFSSPNRRGYRFSRHPKPRQLKGDLYNMKFVIARKICLRMAEISASKRWIKMALFRKKVQSVAERLATLYFYPVPYATSAVVEYYFPHAHSRSPACLSSTFLFPLLNRKGKYKPAGKPRLKWTKLAKQGENKR